MDIKFNRIKQLIGTEKLITLSKIHIGIFGVGGVGSWTAESLIRSGVFNITIVDPDTICATNINRQLQTNSKNIGKSKAIELKNKLLEINPDANITTIEKLFTHDTMHLFDFDNFDYIIDSIDSLKDKILLLETCLNKNRKVFSSMGAAGKIDPEMIRVNTISKSNMCRLAKWVRKRLRRKKVLKEFWCVYSEEALEKTNKNYNEKVKGSLPHITGIFGLMLSGLVIKDILGKLPKENPSSILKKAF